MVSNRMQNRNPLLLNGLHQKKEEEEEEKNKSEFEEGEKYKTTPFYK
jgi:transcription antitermination factor NusG